MVGLSPGPSRLGEHVEGLALVDHHVHGTWSPGADVADGLARLADAFTEADTAPLAVPAVGWDTQVGLAVRRWCAPLLDLPAHASPETYVARRAALGEAEVVRRFTGAAGVSDWLVDTGTSWLMGPGSLAEASGGRAWTITRLESLAEELVLEIDDPSGWEDAFGARVEQAAATNVGFKSVLAYRAGFAVDLAPPSSAAVVEAAHRWQASLVEGTPPRLTDPVLLVAGIYAALRTGKPLQLHVGFGDRDLDLGASDPVLLTPLLRRPEVRGVPIMLLHCYPYERSAGYLAQAFPEVHLDVGLAVHHLGAAASGGVSRSLELAPFRKVLYASDAAGPPEFHLLGARLWRTAMTSVLGTWADRGDWSLDDAVRVSTLVGRDNARRVYGLD